MWPIATDLQVHCVVKTRNMSIGSAVCFDAWGGGLVRDVTQSDRMTG